MNTARVYQELLLQHWEGRLVASSILALVVGAIDHKKG